MRILTAKGVQKTRWPLLGGLASLQHEYRSAMATIHHPDPPVTAQAKNEAITREYTERLFRLMVEVEVTVAADKRRPQLLRRVSLLALNDIAGKESIALCQDSRVSSGIEHNHHRWGGNTTLTSTERSFPLLNGSCFPFSFLPHVLPRVYPLTPSSTFLPQSCFFHLLSPIYEYCISRERGNSNLK